MPLKIKLLITMLLLGLLPAIVLSIFSMSTASSIIETQRFAQLESLREAKNQSLTSYFSSLRAQATVLSRNPSIVSSVLQLDDGYSSYVRQLNTKITSRKKKQLTKYYQEEFIDRFEEGRLPPDTSSASIVDEMSDNAIALQRSYIQNNSYDIGEKHKLDAAGQRTLYDRAHAKVHPVLRSYLETYAYYDIFLINNSGEVVYSVFKEVDFATSLDKGPYRESGLSRIYNLAKAQPLDADPVIVDFAPYLPSYNAPAGFIASPIFDGSERVGVVAFQFPTDQINNIMNDRTGLGETGNAYLVGADSLLRSNLLLGENNLTIEDSFASPESNKIDSGAIQAGIAGKSGVQLVTVAGKDVLSAFSPLGEVGLNWALMVEISEQEAFEESAHLKTTMLLVMLGGIIVIIGAAMYVTKTIVDPLGGEPTDMASLAENIAAGDLTTSFTNQNESGLYKSMHGMVDELKQMISKILGAADQQASAAEELSAVTLQSGKTIQAQLINTEQVATAMNEMSATVSEVTRNTVAASETMKSARKSVIDGAHKVDESSREVQGASEIIFEAQKKIDMLKESANNIAGILESVKGIADQTNLLALNAAIEAARAGEQGRGFAVVADEVRSLAQNTQESTDEIAQMISHLQGGANEASGIMEKCVDRMQVVSNTALTTAENLKEVVGSAEEVDDMLTQIASASEEQSVVAEDINQKVIEINNMGHETGESSSQISSATEELSRLSLDLKDLVSHFRTA